MDYAQLKGGWGALLERTGWGQHEVPAVAAFAFVERANACMAAFARRRPAAADAFDCPSYAMLYLAAEAPRFEPLADETERPRAVLACWDTLD